MANCAPVLSINLRIGNVDPMIETATVAVATFFATIGPLDVAAMYAALTATGALFLLFYAPCADPASVSWPNRGSG